jgi:SAM-dependent methyltransferase
MHDNSIRLFLKYAREYFTLNLRVLEIGPDRHPSTFRSVIARESLAWDTIDIAAAPDLTYVALGDHSFPIEAGAYDIVVSGQVIEHVRRPWLWLQEVARVTKPGGLVIMICPVSWQYHEAPVDCWRIYPEGMRALYEDAGLETVLSVWESLEQPGYPRYSAGVSLEWQSRKKRWLTAMLGPLGFPVERSYDTITIGRKPRSEA